jgi:hypothetical protein
MQRVNLEIYTTVAEAVNIVTDVADHKVELAIPAGSVLLDNILNLRLILEQAKKVGKEVDIVTDDDLGKNLVAILRGEKDEVVVGEPVRVDPPTRLPLASKLPVLKLPVMLGAFPKVLGGKKLGVGILPIAVLLVAAIGLVLLSRQHKAEVVLYFSPQVLTKSVEIKVGAGLSTDADKKVLAGVKVAGTATHTLTASSTGVELEGEKAKGKVTLYNPTLEAVTVKKGTQLTYKAKDVAYVFVTQTEVVVPAGTDTTTTITKGTAEVSVTAEVIGPAYNIKKDKELSIKGYKSTELTAASSEDFKGGSSEEVKVVTQADLTKLEQDLTAGVATPSAEVSTLSLPAGYTLIAKSETVVSKNIVLTSKVGDKHDELAGSITAQVEGLAYSSAELAEFMGKVSQNVVPQGFDFYAYNKDLQVEALGNTEKTVLSPTEADLQVTFKFFIAPKIDKQKIFDKIAGLTAVAAVAELNKISDIERSELKLRPNLVFFNKVPTKQSAVDIQIKIEE